MVIKVPAVAILVAISALAVATPVKDPRCALDLVYVVDQSTSMTGTAYFGQVVPFLVNLTTSLNIGPTGDHVAFIPFGSPVDTNVAFFLDYSYDKVRVINALQKERYRGGSTATMRALTLARNMVLLENEGARTSQYGKKTVVPVILVVTDGIANDSDPTTIANKLRSEGVALFAIGFGPAVTPQYLSKITGTPENVFYAKNSTELLNQTMVGSVTAAMMARCGGK